MLLKNLIKVAHYYNVKYKFAVETESLSEISTIDDFWKNLEIEAKILTEKYIQEEISQEDIEFEINNLSENYKKLFDYKFNKNIKLEPLKDFIKLVMDEHLDPLLNNE